MSTAQEASAKALAILQPFIDEQIEDMCSEPDADTLLVLEWNATLDLLICLMHRAHQHPEIYDRHGPGVPPSDDWDQDFNIPRAMARAFVLDSIRQGKKEGTK